MSNSTRKVLKSLKNLKFKHEGFINVGEVELPVVSRSIGETTSINSSIINSIKVKIPKKTRFATQEEAEELKKKDPQMKGVPMITVYDEENAEFQKKSLELITYQKVLEGVGQYIDMDYETETGTIWADWGLQKKDWMGLGKYLVDNFTEKELEEMEIAIKAIFGDRVHMILLKLQEMSGKSVIEILRAVNRISDIEKLEEELKEKAIALKGMEEDMYSLLETMSSQFEVDEDEEPISYENEAYSDSTDENLEEEAVDEVETQEIEE